MKTIEFANGITVKLADNGYGEVESDIPHETCPFCGQSSCVYSCDESQAGGFTDEGKASAEDEDALRERLQSNAAIDAVESLVLALAVAFERRGMEIPKDVIDEAITTTFDALSNNLC